MASTNPVQTVALDMEETYLIRATDKITACSVIIQTLINKNL